MHESQGLDLLIMKLIWSLQTTESLHLCNLQCNDDSSHPTHSRKLKDLLFIQRHIHITVKCGWSQCTTGTYLQVCWQPRCSLPVYLLYSHCRYIHTLPSLARYAPHCHGATLVSMVTVAIPGTIATFLRNLINDHYTLCQAMYDITNVQNAIMEKFT